jgi:hypothetical protein
MRLHVLGRIHPQEGDWVVEEIRELSFPDGTWHLAIRHSSVVVTIEGAEPTHFGTFVNEVRSVVGGLVDVLGFELAIPLRFEATHAIKDGGETVYFIQQGWPELRALEAAQDETWVPEIRLGPLVSATVGTPLLRWAIADSQRAIEAPDDTAFYCYRAIESLRHLFLDGDDEGAVRSRSWERLRDELGLTRDELDSVKEFADKRRHGGHSVLTEDDRRLCLLTTRRAIRSAVQWTSARS